MIKISVSAIQGASAKVDSKLAKLEREISNVAAQGRGARNRPQTAAGTRRAKSQPVDAIRQKVANFTAFCKVRSSQISALARRLVTATIRRPSLTPTSIFQNTRPPIETMPPSKNQNNNKLGALHSVSIWMSFGLVLICGVLILALLLQVRHLKSEIAQWENELAATRLRLNKLEKNAQQAVAKEPDAHNSAPPNKILHLDEADIKIVRQFIKVLPPKPGTQQGIHLRDEIPIAGSAPIPDSLVERLPQLRGSRFSIDQDGSIIIMTTGSTHPDLVIPLHQ